MATSRKKSIASAPAPGLSRERILSEALALIDAHGLDAFSLRELATRLDVYPTAIYWHVPNRNELVAGAVGLALEEVVAVRRRGTWQRRLRTLFADFRACLQRHPNLAPLVAGELGSNNDVDLALADRIVAALEDAGFDGTPLVDAYNVVVAGMCGFATLELSRPPVGDEAGWRQAREGQLGNVVPTDHPALSRHMDRLRNRAYLLRWTSGTDSPMDRSFAAWVDVVISGLEQRVVKRKARRSAT